MAKCKFREGYVLYWFGVVMYGVKRKEVDDWLPFKGLTNSINFLLCQDGI